MNYLSLDLEMSQPQGNIISIGAVVGDVTTGQILGEFHQLVSLLPGDEISEFIETLTGINEFDLALDGIPLVEAYRSLLQFRSEFPDVQCNPLTWGGGDSAELRRQLGDAIKNEDTRWPFGHRWIDVKTIFQWQQLVHGKKTQAGLAKAMRRYNLSFQGRKHNAKDDALNTFRLAHHLIASQRTLLKEYSFQDTTDV